MYLGNNEANAIVWNKKRNILLDRVKVKNESDIFLFEKKEREWQTE